MKRTVSFLLLLSTVYSANIGFRDDHKNSVTKDVTRIEEESLIRDHKELIDGRIAGGSLVDISEIPYMAALVIVAPSNTLSYCGGIIISSTRILTAAHCRMAKASYVVALGTNQVFHGGVRINATDCIPHPGYKPGDPSNIHDIAMVVIPAITFTDLIQPISLPNSEESSYTFVGETAVTAGYGVTPKDPTIHLKQTLRAVEVQVISATECGALYGTTGSRDESICTSADGGKGICIGDGGGPLTVVSNNRRILIGVTSFGAGCGSIFPSGYVRITQYLSWILST